LYTSFYLESKNNHFLYTQFEDFFFEDEKFFDKVLRYEFGRLHQKGPETDQPALPVVEFTLTTTCTLVSHVVKPDGDKPRVSAK
jgi:hypothetical protein